VRGGCVDALLVHATAAGSSQGSSTSTASRSATNPNPTNPTNPTNPSSSNNKTAHFMYQEAFLTTYRTFVTPCALLDKLLYRYRRFSRAPDTKRTKLARNAFSLLVRVVDELWYVFRVLCLGVEAVLQDEMSCGRELW
jgi:hypothetical protein